MSQIKGKTVFMIVYNYADYDYSVIKIMSNLEDAFKYICDEESSMSDLFKLLEINKVSDLPNNFDDNIYVCYIKSGNYEKFDLCNYDSLSNYAIVPMVIG